MVNLKEIFIYFVITKALERIWKILEIGKKISIYDTKTNTIKDIKPPDKNREFL